MKINCIAIEDEPLALKKITDFIYQIEYLKLAAGFDNAIKAVDFLKNNSIDLIFLDIRMKNLTGIQFLESLKIKSKVIITSAYDEYALKGYELDVSDYLLKPFTFDRFLKSVEKIHHELFNNNIKANQGYIFVKTEYRIEKIDLKDIWYIKGMKDYLQIHTAEKKIMTLQSFKDIEKILPENEFVRVHNSYIVSLSKIESIERSRIKIKTANVLIPISDSYKNNFYNFIQAGKYLI
jgi:DNA-binding LytR/AlgR family response regulator